MPTALVTGITGQDGYYLSELLLSKNYHVIATTRNANKAKASLTSDLMKRVHLIEWDLFDQNCILKILDEYRPTELYNCAAYSSGEGMFSDAVAIGEVNGVTVVRILEAIRAVDNNIRFCQASSSEIFGEPIESPQSEDTPFQPRSPYGAAKLYAHSMIRIYRQRYGLFGCSAILFNHESPRRGFGFVTRKITQGVAAIKLGLDNELCLGNLDVPRDWGYAADYVRAMWLMLQRQNADDYVVATGKMHSVREFCEIAFGHVGLNYRDYVLVDPAAYRPAETMPLLGNASKARKLLGWQPSIGFHEMVCMMVDSDLQMLNTKLKVLLCIQK